jgi:DNA-binding beta-propeller fold protein YncE
MKKLLLAGLFAGAMAVAADASHADGGPILWFEPFQFAVLPDGVRYPEGITANPATGDIFVGTFDFGPNTNALLRFDREGHLSARRDFGGTPLLGLGFDASQGKVYILNMGASKVQRIAASFDANTPIEDVADVPKIGAPADRVVGNPDGSNDTIKFGSNSFPAPNAMAFDPYGNMYFSDSFQGAIYKIPSVATCAQPCAVLTLVHDPLLATAGFPPFGANGLAISADVTTMYIANTGDNRVLRMDMTNGHLSVFSESLHGADGLLFDGDGSLWVAANQADQLVRLDSRGRPNARIGRFRGIRDDGTPRGFLFPASMVTVDGVMYVTNLALPLTPAVGDEPEEDVTRWNIVRMRVTRH